MAMPGFYLSFIDAALMDLQIWKILYHARVYTAKIERSWNEFNHKNWYHYLWSLPPLCRGQVFTSDEKQGRGFQPVRGHRSWAGGFYNLRRLSGGAISNMPVKRWLKTAQRLFIWLPVWWWGIPPALISIPLKPFLRNDMGSRSLSVPIPFQKNTLICIRISGHGKTPHGHRGCHRPWATKQPGQVTIEHCCISGFVRRKNQNFRISEDRGNLYLYDWGNCRGLELSS